MKTALLHTGVVSIALLLELVWVDRWKGSAGIRARWLLGAVLLVSVGEISVANHWLISTVPVAAFDGETQGLAGLKEVRQQVGVEPLRIYRSEMGALPPGEWANVSASTTARGSREMAATLHVSQAAS